jgi:outer membrane usher protein
MVGYDGVLFIEGLRAQNRVRVGSGKAVCEVRFDYKPVAGELPVIGPLVCQPLQGE